MRKLYLLLLVFVGLGAYSQEVLTGLQINPAVRARLQTAAESGLQPYMADTLPVNLPFFDDFSANSVFPSPLRWIDRYAFENNDYPIYPVNLGAMTLDAINDSGRIYPNAVPGPQTYIADHLTSRYIRLDSLFSPIARALHPSDSVYLSFYYQPQGRGLEPETSDSLVLRFLIDPAHDSITPTDTTAIPDRWREIWSTKGMSLDTFYLHYNTYFRQILIPITDTVFFKKNFRFQFYNYVSMASIQQPAWQSNCDQWNLDNVYLNAGRSQKDTIIREMRFIQRAPSLLKNYESMPYSQYCDNPTEEIADSLYILMSNRDTITRKAAYKYTVTGISSAFNKTYDGGQDSIRSFYKYGYVTYIPFAHPPLPFLIPISGADSALFSVRHVLKDLTPGSPFADTIQRYQRFYNYFAYDDGTAEAGYGIKGADAKMACRFKLNKSPDTLRGVYIYFNRTLESTNGETVYFYLTVWNDNNGTPGDTIYSRLVSVAYSDSLNQFVGYRLQVPVQVTGTFYVGTIQTTSDNLNIGYDRYNNSQSNLFFNAIGTWLSSAYTGSVMVRPIVGKPINLGIAALNKGSEKPLIYPNPCAGESIQIDMPGAVISHGNSSRLTVTVYSLVGKEMLQARTSGTLDVSGLPDGMYIVGILDSRTQQYFSSKLIINR